RLAALQAHVSTQLASLDSRLAAGLAAQQQAAEQLASQAAERLQAMELVLAEREAEVGRLMQARDVEVEQQEQRRRLQFQTQLEGLAAEHAAEAAQLQRKLALSSQETQAAREEATASQQRVVALQQQVSHLHSELEEVQRAAGVIRADLAAEKGRVTELGCRLEQELAARQ
ncbi:hypothetical protein HaLaN_09692, partial [Haematococcus lacustris]